MPRRIFAADDWGFSPGINAGILELAKLGQLRNVSLVANADHLTHRLDELLAFACEGLRYSLHLNFTYGAPLSASESLRDCATHKFYSHGKFTLRAYLGRLRVEDVRAEFAAQLRRLRELDVPVTGVDGHHHVHLLPPITKAIQELAAQSGLRRFRLMTDAQHFSSYLQTCLSPYRREDLNYESCHYLLPRDLQSRARYKNKIQSECSLLVHPALYDDFARVGMTDNLRGERVRELKKIMEFSGGTP